MIWLLEYTKEPGRQNYITNLKIVNKIQEDTDYGLNPKFYTSEKELFRKEIISIVKYRLADRLSFAYEDVLPQVDKLVERARDKYPELLI